LTDDVQTKVAGFLNAQSYFLTTGFHGVAWGDGVKVRGFYFHVLFLAKFSRYRQYHGDIATIYFTTTTSREFCEKNHELQQVINTKKFYDRYTFTTYLTDLRAHRKRIFRDIVAIA
jgi:hypothetical protein